MILLCAGPYKTKPKLLCGDGWPELDFSEMVLTLSKYL